MRYKLIFRVKRMKNYQLPQNSTDIKGTLFFSSQRKVLVSGCIVKQDKTLFGRVFK